MAREASLSSRRRAAGPSAEPNAGPARSTIADRLEQAILTGVYRPGERLTEINLAREIGVSQASIREALQELEARSLVVKRPNWGTFVIEIDAVTLRHIFDVRRELEPLACVELARTLTSETREELNACLREMEEAEVDSDYSRFWMADLRFHRLIWQRQPNRVLERLLTVSCLPLFAYDRVRRYAQPYQNFRNAIRQHRLIVHAIETGAEATIQKVTRRMIDRWFREDLRDYTAGKDKTVT